MRKSAFETLAVAMLALAGASCLSYGQDENRPIWEQEAMLVYSESEAEFTRLRTLGRSNERLARYTRALEILHGQRAASETEEEPYLMAQSLFSSLVEANDEDAIGLASQYYLARIAQSNPIEKDMSTAKRLYFDLYEARKDRFFGQMAFIKYATLEIYDEEGSEPDMLTRIQKLEPHAESLTIPDLRRNFHRVLGEAYARFDLDPKQAFKHLDTAYQMGLPVESIKAEVLARIATLGEAIGERERALQAYNELLLIDPFHEDAAEFAERAEALRRQLNRPAAKASPR